MITIRGDKGKLVAVSFESRDTLEEIASVCRCTADELADLMYFVYLTDWQGQVVNWEEE